MAGFAALGRLIEPFVEYSAPSGHAVRTIAAPWNAWRHQRRSAAETRRAVQLLRDAVPSFDVSRFLTQQRVDYETIFRSVTDGRFEPLKTITAEHTFGAIRRGSELSAREFGARQGARITSWLAAPALVHARVAYGLTAGVRAYDAKPDVAQLTVRNVTVQQPVAEADGAVQRTRGGAVAAAAPSSAAAAADAAGSGEWYPVHDAASGHVYWFNAVTGVVRWDAPSPAQLLVSRMPWRIEGAGTLREPLPDGSGVRVTHFVVWERNLRAGAPPAWRVVKL